MDYKIKYAAVIAVVLLILSSCKKEQIDPIPDAVKDRWDVMPLDEIRIPSSEDSYEILINSENRLFGIQNPGLISSTYCVCKDELDNWTRFKIDSTVFTSGRTLLSTVDGSDIWVLTDTRLIKISTCGTFESYVVANADTLTLNIAGDRFVGLEIVNGTPWLLHEEWGMFSYDLGAEALEHHPITDPIPFYTELSEIGFFHSMAHSSDGRVMFNNYDGRAWVVVNANEVYPLELNPFIDYWYYSFETSPTNQVISLVRENTEEAEMMSLPDFRSVPTLALSEAPEFFTNTVLDNDGYLAYYSGTFYAQPYIGLQPDGSDELIVNAQDAVEQGNVVVYDLAFDNQNELYVATNQGILKYLGRNE